MIQEHLSFEEFGAMLRVRLREVREADPEQQGRLVQRAWAMTRNGVPWQVVVASTRAACPLAFELLETSQNDSSLEGANPAVSYSTATDLPVASGPTTAIGATDARKNEAASISESQPLDNPRPDVAPSERRLGDDLKADAVAEASEGLLSQEWEQAGDFDLVEEALEFAHDADTIGRDVDIPIVPGESGDDDGDGYVEADPTSMDGYGAGRVDPRDLATEPPLPLRQEAGRYERERLSSITRQTIRMARHAKRWHEIRKMRNVLLGIDQAYLKRMLGDESEMLNQEINALLRTWAPLVREGRHRPVRRRR